MGYERDPRNNSQGDAYGRRDTQDYGTGRDDQYAGSRDQGGDRDRNYGNRDQGFGGYGQRDGGGAGYGQRGGYGQQYGQSRGGYDGGRDRGTGGEYRGSYGAGGRRFEDVGSQRHADDDNYNDPDAHCGDRDRSRGDRDQGRQPQGHDYQDRGFVARAGDEVRSWFGDDEAERRRDQDARADERQGGGHADRHRDEDYHSWRSTQIAALDRDYDEYRQENRSKFHNEFGAWRSERQGQRDQLSQVKEHAEVVGSDGAHVGTVDKVRGDRILLTKTDKDAGGQHHSIPSRWLQSVAADRITIGKTADEAKKHWRDEEGNQALFGDSQRGTTGDRKASDDPGAHTLNKSFSGTY